MEIADLNLRVLTFIHRVDFREHKRENGHYYTLYLKALKHTQEVFKSGKFYEKDLGRKVYN